MRKMIAVVVLFIGLLPALLALDMDWGSRVVMMCVGLMFAGPVAGVIAWFGKGKKCNYPPAHDQQDFEVSGQELSPSNLASPYWLKDGHYPFTKPSQAPPDLHQFDPQNLTWPHD